MAMNFVVGSSQYLSYTGTVRSAVPMTMACWFRRPTSVGAQYTLMSVGKSSEPFNGNNHFTMRYINGASGSPQLYAMSGGNTAFGQIMSSTVAQYLNRWHHCCAVFASSTSRTAYFHGSSLVPSSGSSTPTGMDYTTIGVQRASSNTYYANGDIAEAAIWSVALSQAEVNCLVAGLHPLLMRPDSIVAYWPLLGRGGPTEHDLVGGYHMSPVNSPVASEHHPPVRWPKRQSLILPPGSSGLSIPVVMSHLRQMMDDD